MTAQNSSTPDITAVKSAVLRYIDATFERVVGVCFTGSRITGGFDADSDFDVQVIHGFDWWQKVNVALAGVDVDLAVGPSAFFEEALRRRNLRVAHMLSTCEIQRDADGSMRQLANRGRSVLEAYSAQELQAGPFDHAIRHRPVTLLRQVRDLMLAGDSEGVDYASTIAVHSALQSYVSRTHRPLDVKHQIRYLRKSHPEIASVFGLFIEAAGKTEDRYRACKKIVEMAYADIGGISEYGTTEPIKWQHALAFMQ